LQTTTGDQAATISAQAVTNGVNSINPVYASAAVANAKPSLLEMTYNLTLANIVPAVSSFSVLVNSAARTVSTVVISGTKVQLTLSSPIVYGDVITVSYIKPSFNFLQTSSAGIAASISNQPVTNNCINIAPTVVITSPVINSSFTSPATITITANASDTDGSISMVEFYSGSTKIGSFSSAPYSFTWNNVASGSYSLTVIATDNKNAKTTSSAIPITVNNGTYATNKHPMIKISNPRKGNNYDNLSSIEIDATASDPDGSISKVEIYNGAVKLVEMSSAPYTFTWKDVAAGTYKITAIATDNLNDTTISSPVEFIVGVKVKYDANSDLINLYPNPNDGHFSIEFISPLKNEKSEIVITDLAGKQVFNGPILKEEITKQFDLSGSKAGIYVMIVKDKDIMVTKKFIKNSQ
jgi:chitinase